MNQKQARYLLIAIVAAVVAGLASGWYFGEAMAEIAWLGELFLNALKMLILPLILAAVISGIASLGDVRKLGKLGGYTVGFYAATTAIAVVVGLIMVNLIEPGAGINATVDGQMPDVVKGKEATGLKDIALSLISPNLVASAADLDLLPIILFAVVFAAAISMVPGNEGTIRAIEAINQAMMKIVIWVMYFAPVGIFALVAGRLGEAGGGPEFWQILKSMQWHVVTVLSALGLHFLILLAIAWGLARRGAKFLRSTARALFTAFGTASSTATVPITMESVKEAGVGDRAVQFAIPLGSTVNMNGTALYEACAALFIAQAYNIDLSFGQQVIIFLTATLAAIGAAGIPEAGLVTMVIVLKAVGLPLEGIGLVLAVDWFLDRFRTAVNVWGDAVAAAVVDRFLPTKTHLQQSEP
ncbi:MAG: dicarboxylate/amino acid:cation symporter [Bacteroidota bacterium]